MYIVFQNEKGRYYSVDSVYENYDDNGVPVDIDIYADNEEVLKEICEKHSLAESAHEESNGRYSALFARLDEYKTVKTVYTLYDESDHRTFGAVALTKDGIKRYIATEWPCLEYHEFDEEEWEDGPVNHFQGYGQKGKKYDIGVTIAEIILYEDIPNFCE